MATQPQKDNLIKLFTENIGLNTESIQSSEVAIQENQSIIDNFDPSCKGLDGQIVSIVGQINALKAEIVTLYTNAYNVGCGSTVGVTTVYPDTAVDSSYNLSNPSYNSGEPYEVTNQTLSNSNVGFGTFVIYTTNNNQVAGLGSAYAGINSCYRKFGTCNTGDCIDYSNQILQKQNQIVSLQSQVNTLSASSNSLRTQRLDYQIRRWADKYTIVILTQENQSLEQSISVLNDPTYDSYI